MLSMTIEQVVAAEGWTVDHAYCLYVIREQDTIFYVGQSIDPWDRLQEHLGGGDQPTRSVSPVGELILVHQPRSLKKGSPYFFGENIR